MFSEEKIQSTVLSCFPGAKVQVRDMTGTKDHFELTVVCQSFEGKSLVERHRHVYETLGEAVGGEIHALSVRAWTPGEAKERGFYE